MSYIAYLNMLGTRAAASIGTNEYATAIKKFHESMNEAASCCGEGYWLYGYNDNAYIQINNLEEMLCFFEYLRTLLFENHLYFSATVECGFLDNNSKNQFRPNKHGYSMIFTETDAINVFLAQSNFCGIGVSLSKSVIAELNNQQYSNRFFHSVFQPNINDISFQPVIDLAYDNIVLEQIKCILADYITTSVMDKKAGRYYITPIITMIKCLDAETVKKNLEDLILLITFKSIPKAFYNELNEEYSMLFVFALFDYVLSLNEQQQTIDASEVCKKIIIKGQIDIEIIINKLSKVCDDIISASHKNKLMKILFNMNLQEE